MKSKGNQPTAAQVRWREAVRGLGSVISGGPAVIHHPVGCTGKHNKIAIGHWWIIPLTDEEHKQLHGHVPIWDDIMPVHSRKQFEQWAFKWHVVEVLAEQKLLPDQYTFDINHAIMDWHW